MIDSNHIAKRRPFSFAGLAACSALAALSFSNAALAIEDTPCTRVPGAGIFCMYALTPLARDSSTIVLSDQLPGVVHVARVGEVVTSFREQTRASATRLRLHPTETGEVRRGGAFSVKDTVTSSTQLPVLGTLVRDGRKYFVARMGPSTPLIALFDAVTGQIASKSAYMNDSTFVHFQFGNGQRTEPPSMRFIPVEDVVGDQRTSGQTALVYDGTYGLTMKFTEQSERGSGLASRPIEIHGQIPGKFDWRGFEIGVTRATAQSIEYQVVALPSVGFR